MNNKMAKNTNISIIESKKTPKRTEEQRQNHGYTEYFDGCQVGDGVGE